ncbi:redoxin family protein [Sphingobacterium phlebotomi]|uniref:Redoxin family protein n=1 Tax=Sphingobacterium phlebotomi TaxID=2605433 RepID=A0A5D4H8K4_9SPHI|nr:thioredoxin domain-containing protein [Sphingobacterium phlebotomi]TYR37481.1 redoxin family protein [Sphingobacterium phlebotomi]
MSKLITILILVLSSMPVLKSLSHSGSKDKKTNNSKLNTVTLQFQSMEKGIDYSNLSQLEVGDTIPLELWNASLQVIGYPEERKTITLNDYKDKKFIVLDFWSTWCGTCIFTLPKTFETLSKFSDQIALIPITNQTKDIIAPFVLKNKYVSAIPNFYSVINNQYYMDVFKIKWMPRVVIINNEGVVIAITKPAFIVEESIKDLLDNRFVEFPQAFVWDDRSLNIYC